MVQGEEVEEVVPEVDVADQWEAARHMVEEIWVVGKVIFSSTNLYLY